MDEQRFEVEVIIRERRTDDSAELSARARLLRASVIEHIMSAFLIFLFNERQRQELFGCVAVAREPLLVCPGKKYCVILKQEPEDHVKLDTVASAAANSMPRRYKIVGTVSVEESREPLRTGWLLALAVDPQYRCQGIGSALVNSICALAVSQGLLALEATTSEIQQEARSLLHTLGWETRAAYHRKLCGGAYTLALTHLFYDLQVT